MVHKSANWLLFILFSHFKIRLFMSRFLLLALFAAIGHWLCAQTPVPYLKRLSDPQLALQSQSMCPTADGNFYLAGKKDIHPFILKLNPEGELLWMRSIPIGTPTNNSSIVEILEDSEGKIVFCSRQSPTPTTRNTYVMRFDPVGDTLYWFKGTGNASPIPSSIVENGPGGNFLLTVSRTGGGVTRPEIIEINRNTGLVVSTGGINQYTASGSSATTFQKMITDQGSIYAVGGRRANASSPFVPLFCKISTQTDEPEWNRVIVADTTTAITSDISYDDMVLDDSSAILVGSGLKDMLNTALGRFVYLAKHNLDGTLLWLKRYDFSMIAEDVVSVPDGYVIFGKMADNQWGILKTDKNGQMIQAKTIKTSNLTAPLTLNPVRQGQLIRVADQLLMTDYFSYNGMSDVLLISTDLNIGLKDSCSFVSEASVSQENMPAQTNLLVMNKVAGSVFLGDGGVIYEDDALTVCGICPLSPCCEPDLAIQALDSVFCTNGNIRFGLRLCNEGGSATAQAINVTFYDNNPFTTTANALQTVALPDTLEAGECKVFPLDLEPGWFQNTKLYVLVGSKGDVPTPISALDFPLNGGFLECGYANNLDSITLALPPLSKLDLGPDRNICVGQSVTLDAGPDFINYQWQGGPTARTYTVTEEGDYFVRTIDACGRQQFDTIAVHVVPLPTRLVSIVLLPGDAVVINGKTYRQTSTVTDTITAVSGACDSLITYNIRLDERHCGDKADAFFKVNYAGLEASNGRVILAASDGSIYTAGELYAPDNQYMWTITKSKPNGEILWSRKFETIDKFYVLQMIEDSEGNLVGTRGQIERVAGGLRFFNVFRYNPNTDQMLWITEVTTPETMPFPKIIAEKTPGNNYVVCYSLIGFVAAELTEYCELDRNSGQIINGSQKQFGPNIRVLGAVKHENQLLLNGFIADVVQGKQLDGFAIIDLTTGTMAQKIKLPSAVQFPPIGGPAAVDNDGNLITLMYQADKSIYLRKTTIDGNPVWLKSYSIANINVPYLSVGSVAAVSDGYVFTFELPIQNGQRLTRVATKIDKDGKLVWSKSFGTINVVWPPSQHSLQVTGDNIFITGATEFNLPDGSPQSGSLLVKMDKDGNAGDSCAIVQPIEIIEKSHSISVETAVMGASIKIRGWETKPKPQATAFSLFPYTLCSLCPDACDTIRTVRNITFYPGDTIVIDGKQYTQSDTVLQSFTTAAGCDSIVTNILRLVVTNVDISCPADLTVTLPPNSSGTVVDYSLPTAQTDCPDPKITLKLIQGPGVGAIFPTGINTVCYEASNSCGAKDTCCFKVTVVNPETACDFKAGPNCMRYELLSVKFDAQGQRRYRIRLSNSCPSPVQFVYIQSPNGVNAVSPTGGSVYTTAPAGRAYDVRNPNASPFASIRFKAQTGGLKGGASDIFEYSLPQQSAPVYILVAVRLENGEYYEAYLNTFNCPAQPYDGNRSKEADPAPRFTLSPNPSRGLLVIDFGPDAAPLRLGILNTLGQTVQVENSVSGSRIQLQLPENLSDGLYYMNLVWPDGSQVTERFVLKR